MRKLNVWRIAAIGALIVALFIAVACSQTPSSATSTVEPDAIATFESSDAGGQVGDQTTGTADTTSGSTAPATQEAVEAIIDDIVADLLSDALADLRDLEEGVEADLVLVAGEEQVITAGDSF